MTRDEILDILVAREEKAIQAQQAADALNTQAEALRMKYEADLQALQGTYATALDVMNAPDATIK